MPKTLAYKCLFFNKSRNKNAKYMHKKSKAYTGAYKILSMI